MDYIYTFLARILRMNINVRAAGRVSAQEALYFRAHTCMTNVTLPLTSVGCVQT